MGKYATCYSHVPPGDVVACFRQEVAKLRAEVEQLRKRPAASEQDATEVAKLRAENDELKKRPASLPAKKAKVQQNEIASLKERLRSASSAASLSSAAAPEVKLKGTLQDLVGNDKKRVRRQAEVFDPFADMVDAENRKEMKKRIRLEEELANQKLNKKATRVAQRKAIADRKEKER